MTCSRCGAREGHSAHPEVQVDVVAVMVNGIVRRQVVLCQLCRPIVDRAWSRATEPVGLAAA